jgi:hypothetical protein
MPNIDIGRQTDKPLTLVSDAKASCEVVSDLPY